MDSTVAKIGRSMKNRAIMARAPLSAWAGPEEAKTAELVGRLAGSLASGSLALESLASGPVASGSLALGRVRRGSISSRVPAERRHRHLLGADRHARPDLLQAADDDPVVRLQPLGDHAQAVVLERSVVTRRYWTLLSLSTT